jgi:hypothetical protein
VRHEPIGSDIVFGVGEAGAGFLGARRLSRVAVRIPRGGDDSIQFISKRCKRGIVKTAAEALFKFGAREFDGRRSSADFHIPSPSRPPDDGRQACHLPRLGAAHSRKMQADYAAFPERAGGRGGISVGNHEALHLTKGCNHPLAIAPSTLPFSSSIRARQWVPPPSMPRYVVPFVPMES